MKKFNKSVKVGTKVQVAGDYGFRIVKKIHETRNWIKIDGLDGSFQVGHIVKTSNRDDVEMFPAIEDEYKYDAYCSVYEWSESKNIWMFIGKILSANDRNFRKFVKEYKNDLLQQS